MSNLLPLEDHQIKIKQAAISLPKSKIQHTEPDAFNTKVMTSLFRLVSV